MNLQRVSYIYRIMSYSSLNGRYLKVGKYWKGSVRTRGVKIDVERGLGRPTTAVVLKIECHTVYKVDEAALSYMENSAL